MIVSLSGIRGVPFEDLTPARVSLFAARFAEVAGSSEVLAGRDSRSTGPPMSKAVMAGIMSTGASVHDQGIISTPALFRLSRLTGLPAVMVTASHNEPEYNGLKFIIGGMGIGKEVMDRVVVDGGRRQQFPQGRAKGAIASTYAEDLVAHFGARSCEGVRVALDLGGGAAITHFPILRRVGCELVSVNDAYGVFNRRVDPVADELTILCKMVKEKECDVGFGFDCDGDRLVVVDSQGRKKTGDYMLTMVLSELLRKSGEKKVVVSLDTTKAVDEVARKAGAGVVRARVGEANVVSKMREEEVRFGGEGSSGGMIDGNFNYCRDSMIAGLTIVAALKREGRKLYGSIPEYHIERRTVKMARSRAKRAMKRMASAYKDADVMDGVKVTTAQGSWVLVRPSGTEDLVRVSAEAETAGQAEKLVKSYTRKLLELSR